MTNSTNITGSTNPLLIGSLFAGSYTHFFHGYVSEVEVVKGTAINTSDYTPSTSPFPDSASAIIDKTGNTVTVIGTAAVVADASAFGGYCLQANQASGYVSTPSST